MSKNSQSILQFVRFVDMARWSVSTSVFEKRAAKFPLISLSKVLKRVKDPITIEDDLLYKRITVHLYGQGVHQRDELYGRNIGTKKQYLAHAGELIISRIDARNGAFGIVPEELEGAIVTNDFWIFDVNGAIAQYLTLVLSSDLFQQYWRTQSSGTTNRQRIDESSFLMSKIALPSIEIQNTLLNQYNKLIYMAQCLESNSEKKLSGVADYLMNKLNLHNVEALGNTELLNFIAYKNLTNKWEWNNLSETVEKAMANSFYPIKPLGQVLSFVNRRWKEKNHFVENFMYIEIGSIDAINNTANANEVKISEAPSRATQTVKAGDLIIGTTRPYLKRFALIRNFEDGYVCSSGFQVIEESPSYDLRYILEVLKLDPIIKQFETLMTGALYPAVNAEQLRQVRIPIPPIEIQRDIANHIEKEKEESRVLRQQAESLRYNAKKGFEEAIFSE